MDAENFRSLLAGGPVLADGAMGTALIERGAPVDACLDEWSLREPAAVEAVHRASIDAGARIVWTNTFGANRFRLERHGLHGRVAAICAAGVGIARRAGAEIVAGSLGPLGVRLAPYGRVRPSDAADAYREQAEALAASGVDLLVLETQSDLREVEQAVGAIRAAASGLALIVSATFTRDDRTLLGSSPEQVADGLLALGVDAIGVNCGEGPAQVLRVAQRMRAVAGDAPLVARPNAGGPAEVGGRLVYPATPAYVGEVARALLAERVAVLGGCCGTGPEHVAAIGEAIREAAPDDAAGAHASGTDVTARRARVRVEVGAGALDDDERPSARAAAPSALEASFAAAGPTIAVEMEPPRSFNAAALVAAAATLRDAGADAIDVADSPMAKMRMSAWAACRLVQERVGIETVLHFPTRGRNLLRLQGDLLGAHALGTRNLFVCVGDPVTIGDYPQTLNDVDVTATGLLALITDGFNQGVDRAGSSIGEPTAFFTGAAVSPNAPDLGREVRLLRRKVEAGARFLLSQPLYGVGPLRALRRAYEDLAGEPLAVPVLAGCLPLVSARHARFLDNEVPGVAIPSDVLARIERAGEGEAAWREGLAMAIDVGAALRDEGAAGVYVMPQFGRYDRAAELIEAIRRER